MAENCLSGVTVAMPLMLLLHAQAERGAMEVIEAHLRLTHNADGMVADAAAINACVSRLLQGEDPLEQLRRTFCGMRGAQAAADGRPGVTSVDADDDADDDDDEDIDELAALTHEQLFVGADPYALRGQPGCARFSLRW